MAWKLHRGRMLMAESEKGQGFGKDVRFTLSPLPFFSGPRKVHITDYKTFWRPAEKHKNIILVTIICLFSVFTDSQESSIFMIRFYI